MHDFIIYQNDEYTLRYQNEKHPKGFTHLLRVVDSQTGKNISGMWIDPTESGSTALDTVRRLESLQNSNSYNEEVANFLEYLINNAGFSSLQIVSLMKDALKHHTNPEQLIHTIQSVDLSEANFRAEDHISELFNIEEIKTLMAGFIESLKEFVAALLGQKLEEVPEAKGTPNATTSPTNRFYKPVPPLEIDTSATNENDQSDAPKSP